MNIRIDTHTHSVASGHAFSTIDDLARGARASGLDGFVLTDHGPGMPGSTHPYHFGNLRIVPELIEGVRFLSGVEANIMDTAGGVDLAPYLLSRLDFVLAGFHDICFDPGSRSANTDAMIAALSNPLVDAISHPGNPSFPIDNQAVVRAAAAFGKALEINNSSFRIRKGSERSCAELASLCAREGASVVCGSDAHYWRDVGNLSKAVAVIEAAGIPEEQVLNASVDRFLSFCERRKRERAEAAGPSPF
ncbi:MAG: phosphatase [Spirochaetes bacterium]|nr:phosphatase [Spirochaetota bacterium]MBU1080786.1 phosphatase [Spirochaetota bacterium]